jgi:hypothetical protein
MRAPTEHRGHDPALTRRRFTLGPIRAASRSLPARREHVLHACFIGQGYQGLLAEVTVRAHDEGGPELMPADVVREAGGCQPRRRHYWPRNEAFRAETAGRSKLTAIDSISSGRTSRGSAKLPVRREPDHPWCRAPIQCAPSTCHELLQHIGEQLLNARAVVIGQCGGA